jgi:hypothetical protein
LPWKSDRICAVDRSLFGFLFSLEERRATLTAWRVAHWRLGFKCARCNRHPTKREYLWVVPHKLLAGEYPGDEDPGKARGKIDRFFEVGVRHFADLTELGEYEFVPYEAILAEESRAADIETTYQRFPIRDISVPSDAEHLAEISWQSIVV